MYPSVTAEILATHDHINESWTHHFQLGLTNLVYIYMIIFVSLKLGFNKQRSLQLAQMSPGLKHFQLRLTKMFKF
jgi:hypothetical protein